MPRDSGTGDKSIAFLAARRLRHRRARQAARGDGMLTARRSGNFKRNEVDDEEIRVAILFPGLAGF
jgi:hypothetical protein